MSQQIDIPLQARRTDPVSSYQAADRARPKAGSDAARCLSVIQNTPGCSARDIAVWTGIVAYTVRKRTADLRRWGWAHSHAGLDLWERDVREEDRELRWYPGQTCRRCER